MKFLRGVKDGRCLGTGAAALCALMVCGVPVCADTVDDWQTWGNVTATGVLGDAGSPWRAWLEGQGRFNDDTSRFGQGIVRVGLGRQLNPGATLWAGYAFIPTDVRFRSDDTLEHRVWQQLTWSSALPWSGLTVATRSRLEQRRVESADDTGWRVRQLVKLTRPLGSGGRWFLSLWDELFVNLNDTDWGADDGFDQNRVFAGLGLRLAASVNAEVGYLHQYVARKSASDASNHILSLNLFLRF